LLGGGAYGPDLLTILIVYLFLYYGRTPAVAFALGQGIIVDVFSVGFKGLFAFLYMIVCAGILLGCRFFNLRDPKGQIILITLAVLLKRSFFFGAVYFFSIDPFSPSSLLWASVISALFSGLIAPAVFFIFEQAFEGPLGNRNGT